MGLGTEQPVSSRHVLSGGIQTHVLETGNGNPVVLLHGSAPGSTAVQEWRLNRPELAKRFRVISPDMIGFGLTRRPAEFDGKLKQWVDHAVGLLDALEIDRAHLVGHSFGGGLALAIALQRPDRVRTLVLMGSLGGRFHITRELDAVWGYQPSRDSILEVTGNLRFNHRPEAEDVADRNQSSRESVDDYTRMFPEPRQRWINMMAGPEEGLRVLKAPTLILHGRDDRAIPLSNAYRLLELIPNAELHVFTRCGNGCHVERAEAVNGLIDSFLRRAEGFAYTHCRRSSARLKVSFMTTKRLLDPGAVADVAPGRSLMTARWSPHPVHGERLQGKLPERRGFRISGAADRPGPVCVPDRQSEHELRQGPSRRHIRFRCGE